MHIGDSLSDAHILFNVALRVQRVRGSERVELCVCVCGCAFLCVCVCLETGWLQKIYHCLIRLRVSYCRYPPTPSSAQGPGWYISLYMTHAHTHTYTCMYTRIAGQYISLSVTGSVCVSPIIWPLDSNGWERRVGFPCGLNTTAFITHNRSTILALPLTG